MILVVGCFDSVLNDKKDDYEEEIVLYCRGSCHDDDFECDFIQNFKACGKPYCKRHLWEDSNNELLRLQAVCLLWG